jgi:hypothetical protein
VTLVTGANQYGALPWRDLFVDGLNAPNSTGVLVEGNFLSIYNLSVHGFTQLLGTGNNAYLDTFYDLQAWGGGTGVFCPGGTTNAGEGIRFIGGEIFNDGTGIFDAGCQFQLFGTHIDGISASPVVVSKPAGPGGANVEGFGATIELFSQVSCVFSVTGDGAYAGLLWEGGGAKDDTNGNQPLLCMTNNAFSPTTSGPSARFVNGTFGGLSFTESNGTAMSADPLVALCGIINSTCTSAGCGMIGNVPNSGSCP